MMSQHRDLSVAFAGNPVELDNTALAVKRLMAMPGIIAALEGDQGAGGWRHLNDNVVQIRARTKEAQSSSLRLPGLVHVDEGRDDLTGRIGVYLAIARPTATAYGGDCRSALKGDIEFLFERSAKLVAF